MSASSSSASPIDPWFSFQLICKPEQSGKTFIMINIIIQNLTSQEAGKETVNFILCDNNLLLTRQTSVRVDNDLRKHVIDGITYIELSSHERTEFHGTDSVFKAIMTTGVRNIICCTNGRRMDDIFSLISDFNRSLFTTGKFIFNIWLDEADKFAKIIDSTLLPLVVENTNVNVKLITATPQSLFKKYEYMNVYPIENTTGPLYHGWCDNFIRIIEKTGSYLDYADHVLSIVANDLILPGTKWFIPAKNTIRSHDAIRDLCVSKGMAVICVNGKGITISLPGTLERITLPKDDELNLSLLKIYSAHSLERFATVITGYICVGRGITIMSDDFMIDYAILSQVFNKTEASQIAGRVKGNYKGYDHYKPPVVFATENFNEVAIELEQQSRALGALAYAKELDGLPTVINKNEFNTCAEEYDYVCHPSLFNSFEQAKVFLGSKERKMRAKVGATKKNSVIHIVEGYSITSKLVGVNGVAGLTKEDRLTIELANAIAPSRCISSTDKGSRYLILPVYSTMECPGNSACFQVRYINFK